MPSTKKLIKVTAFAALIVIPIVGIIILARAKWVHNPMPYLGQTVVNSKGDSIYHTVSDIHLTDLHGRPFVMDSFKGKIIVASIFFSSCPEVCPEMNGQIMRVAEKFYNLKNVAFLSVSIDPQNDSVPALLKYSKRFNAKLSDAKTGNWRFCTGSKAEIYDWVFNDLLLANEFKNDSFAHDDKVVLIDKERHIRSILRTRPDEDTPQNKWMATKLELFQNICDDIDNLLYEYREKELDK